MKLAKYVKFREEKFGGVLFDTRSERVLKLNPTATAVVRGIREGGSEADILEWLKGGFESGDGKIDTEAAAFIAELKETGLVED